MIKWTTPNLKITIPSDIEFDYLLLTLKQGNNLIEKRVESNEIEDGTFLVNYTQEETGSLIRNSKIQAQINFMAGDTRMATNIVELMITENLHDEVIEDE